MRINDSWKYGWHPIKAIRAKCVECSADQINEVRNCTVTSCPLYEYRFGRKCMSKFSQKDNVSDIFDGSEIEDEDFIEDDVSKEE